MHSKFKINKNLLFIGDLNPYTRTFQRFEILKNIFSKTYSISSENKYVPGINKNNKSLFYRFFFKLGFVLDINDINKKISNYERMYKIDVVWIEKVNCLNKNLIKKLKKKYLLIYYTNDNINKYHNISINYLLFIKYFHYLLIPEDYSYKKKSIFPKVYKFNRSFDCQYIPKIKNIETKVFDIVFIGSYEKKRFMTLVNIAKKINFNIDVFGNGWPNNKKISNNLIIHNKPLYNQEFIQTIKESKIALNFLRNKNNDQTTGRSFEILATNTFMISEKSNLHLRLFDDNIDCVFFHSDDDLIKKIIFYMENEDKRNKISNRGFNKVHSLYTYEIWINNFIKSIYGR